MGVEQKGVCEFDIVFGRDGSCQSVKDSIVGPRDYLDCGGLFGRWEGSCFDFFAWKRSAANSRLDSSIPLSFRHGGVLAELEMR